MAHAMKVTVTIMPKSGVLDPQGKAIEDALSNLGFEGASNVRQGKVIELQLDATDENAARTAAEDMCAKLLANPVMETFHIDVSS